MPTGWNVSWWAAMCCTGGGRARSIEELDDNYGSVFRDHERRVREELQQGRRADVFEAEMKETRQKQRAVRT